jgi:hypothetical protein
VPEQRHERSGRDRATTVRLPGFVSDEDVGLGDVVSRMTSAIGIRPCGGCQRRAAAMNRWLVFSGREHKTRNAGQ